MIKESVQKAINEQINKEFYSAFLYLAMAENFEAMNLKGAAHWLFTQYKEELGHAEKFMVYMNEVGGRVELKAIDAPKREWKSILEAFEDAYKHEVFISESIHKIMDLATRENDFPTQNFLQWFISEQVEEEEQTLAIVQKARLVGEQGYAIYMLDRELAQR